MATLDQVFQREKAWIATSDDVDALMDRIHDYRDDLRVAEREGNMLMRMRAGDLIELAENRVVRLSAGAIREEQARQARPRVSEPTPPTGRRYAPPAPKTVDPDADRSEREHRDGGRRAREQAAQAKAESEKAAARLAHAQAAQVEAQTALLKAQAEAIRQAPAPAASPKAKPSAAASPPPAPMERRISAPPRPAAPAATKPIGNPTLSTQPAAVHRPPREPAPPPGPSAAAEIAEADKLALASVGRWPPIGPAPGHPLYTRDQDWPPEWTLTGLDLAQFRGRIHVTQKLLAAQLRVPTSEIANLEARPREKVGPAMQIALRRAMDVVEAQYRKRRAERESVREAGAAAAAPTPVAPSSAIVPSVPVLDSPASAPPSPAPTKATPDLASGFTGADLARLRAVRKLSQRQLADALGVGHGMVAKAEVAAAEPLGERMRAAVGALLAKGSGTAAA